MKNKMEEENGRLSVAMWDFSWALRRSGGEAEYRDWGRVLDELAERGYDIVRIDAFPQLVARSRDGHQCERFIALPQRKTFPWGSHALVEFCPRNDLAEFIGKAKERGIGVALSAWYQDDASHRRDEIETPEDFARIWGETLDFLNEEGLLDSIVWVDLCNEFTFSYWTQGAYRKIFQSSPSNALKALLPWPRRIRGIVQRYLEDGIAPLRQKYPELKYTYSMGQPAVREFPKMDLSAFDIAEPHIWISDFPDFLFGSGQILTVVETKGGIPMHAQIAPFVYKNWKKQWLEELEKSMKKWGEWSRKRGLPLATSEGWGPIVYDDIHPHGDGREWNWVKDCCAEAVKLAVENGWWAICASNFSQPHFKGMWRDVAWHREMTGLICK